MSFIVEATQRQQQETVPAEAAVLAFDRVRRREKRIWLVVGILTATGVALTVAIIIKWFFLEARETAAAAEVQTRQLPAAVREITSIEDVGSDTTLYQPIKRQTGSETQNAADDPDLQPQVDQIPPQDEVAAPPRTPLHLQAAPESAQQPLLAFSYTAHLYTSEPSKRSVSVNGKRMREGESIGKWVLVEITERGAVWDDGDILVDVPVLDLWL